MLEMVTSTSYTDTFFLFSTHSLLIKMFFDLFYRMDHSLPNFFDVSDRGDDVFEVFI